MKFKKYITASGFEPTELEECLAFHDSTKVKPYSSVKSFLRISEYLTSSRGVDEGSRNYRNYNAPFEDISHAQLPSMSFDDINKNRVSTRQFNGKATFDREKILSALKACCDTRTATSSLSETAEFGFRGYASAGALFPVDIYLLERSADGFTLRYLNPRNSRLYELQTFGAEHHDMLCRALCNGQHDLIDRAQGVLILSTVWERSIVKYGRQGYRFSLMELGIVSHHLSLCLTAMDVGNLHWGGGFEDLVGELVGIDPRSETIGHLLWYGVSDA